MHKKKLLATGLAATLAVSSVLSSSAVRQNTAALAAGGQQPNIVFILLDDTGARELGCFGNTFNETPHIDAVAREGMKFNQFYTEPVCSPSRSCLMTGQNPVRTGITNYLEANNSTYLHPEEFEALPKMLGRAGYETAILGKWHLSGGYQDYPELGPGIPAEHGFDQVIMSEQRYIGPGYYYYPYWHLPQVTDGTPGEYLVDHMNRKAVEYLEERADSDQPFFLYFSHYATHTTLEAPQETVDYFQAKRGESAGRGTQDRNPYLAAMLKHVDDGVGMIDQKLKELGMYDNTILVIASDNGGDLAVTDNGELRGGKTDLYEGGIRDPLLIRWPEKMQGGQETDFPTHMIDFYQTFGEAAGLPPEEIPENSGVSLMPLLSGAGVPDRDTLYWVMLRDTTLTPGFTVDYDTIFREGGAIRKGDYKYLESFAHDRRELYNLAEDPGEHNNLIDRYPEIAQALSRELHSLFERDTYGKTFQTGFDGDEYYLWSNSGAFTYANGSFSSSGASGGAVALQMYLYYDAKVQVDVTAPETGRAGLLFRSSLAKPTNPAFKAYAAVLDAEKGRVELLNVKGQNASVLAAADLELTPGAQYRLRVETDSDQIQIYVDDELVLTCFDQTYLKGGIGLYADGAVTTFDNLTATGVEGMRPVSDRQLGFAPPHDIKVKADGSYIWPDVEPVRQEEEILFDAEAFLTALGGQVDFDPVTGTSTTRFQGLEASYTLGSTQAIAGGETVTLAAAPTVIAGRIHVPLSFLLEALRLDYTAEGDTVDCSSSLETEIRHTETDKITYTGAWITGGEAGDATRSKVKGETAELAFQGTGVRLYVSNGTGAGLCNIYIDDQLADTVDTYSPTTGSDVLAFQKTGLPDGSHTIRVENAGPGQSGSSANLNIHRFVVVKRDPILVNSSEEILYSRTDRIQYTGGWYTGGDAGDCMRSKQAGDTAELSFQGTGIRLYGSNGPGAGIFQVSIDDQPAERVDTYSASSHNDVLFYEIDNLPAGSHTLRVENTGEKNPAGTATNINIRRFVTVNQPAEESKTEEIRYNDQQGRIAYSAGWTIGGPAGAAARSTKAGETAELAFQGTGIEVYVNNGTGAGKLHIYIDDVLTDTVDTYSDKSSSNVLAFSKTDLARGSHVLRLENAGPGQSGKSANINLHRLVVMDNPGAEPSFTPGEVSDRIAALPESLGDTLDSRPAIRAAAAALASLPAEQQAQVDGREKLTALSEAAAAFEAPPAAVNLLLGSLPAPVQVTKAQQDDIAALQADYTALNPEQKLLVVQAKKLTRLQAALDSLLEQTGALQALYDSYADMAQGDYTDTSWAELQAALLEAGAVLASDTATLADADAAITRLSQAAEGLEIQTPQPDGRLEAALKAAGAAVNALAVSNKTTGDDVLTAAREAVDDDIQITWEEPFTLSPATETEAGRISGVLRLTLDGESLSLDVERTIPPIQPDDRLEAALAAASAALDALTVSNDTTADDVLTAIRAAVGDEDIEIAWQEDFSLTPATAAEAGLITGALSLRLEDASEALEISLEIPVFILPGDVDKDGTLSISDVMAACRILARSTGGQTPSDDEMARADLDSSGTIDISDIMRICRLLAAQNA